MYLPGYEIGGGRVLGGAAEVWLCGGFFCGVSEALILELFLVRRLMGGRWRLLLLVDDSRVGVAKTTTTQDGFIILTH